MEILSSLWNMFLLRPEGAKKALKISLGVGMFALLLSWIASTIGSLANLALLGEFLNSLGMEEVFDLGEMTPVLYVLDLVFHFIEAFALTFFMWGAAKILGGKASYMQHFNIVAVLSLLGIVLLVPVVGLIVGIFLGLWAIVMAVYAVSTIHKMSVGAAVGSGFLGMFAYAAVSIVIGIIVGIVQYALTGSL